MMDIFRQFFSSFHYFHSTNTIGISDEKGFFGRGRRLDTPLVSVQQVDRLLGIEEME
jgi:hypothetical protein